MDESQSSTPEREITWTYNPWRANWKRPAAALLIVVFVAALGGFSFTYPDWWPAIIGWGGFGLALLLGMTFTIYIPMRYRLDDKGVTVFFLGVPNTRRWEHYRNFYVHKTGVHVTTMPKPSALDPFRGHFLQYSGNKDQVVAFIKEHMVLRGQPEKK